MEAILAASIPAAIAGFLKLVADNKTIKAGLNGQLDAKLQEVKDDILDVKEDIRGVKADVRDLKQEFRAHAAGVK